MKYAQTLTALLAIVMFCSFPVFGDGLEPLTVSPGATDCFTGVEMRCPTFSWQTVPGAVGYEVVVYELPQEVDLAGWSLDDTVEVLFVALPAGVTAWTPSLENGLARGADHVWFVRGVFDDAGLGELNATEWSVERFFRVDGVVGQPGVKTQARGVRVSSGTETGGAGSRGTRTEPDRGTMAKRVGETKTKDIGTALAAIRGEVPDPTGETYGVVGTSNSVLGAGVAAVNTAGGPDLVLEGVGAGQPDTTLFQWGLDRSSPDPQTFSFGNLGGGGMTLNVDGAEVVTTLTDQDTLSGLSCATWQVAKWDGGNWVCRWDWDTLYGLSCAGGEIAKWNGAEWVCGTDWDTVGSLSCASGEIAKWDGASWGCTSDYDTTYQAGNGLVLVGTEFRTIGSGFDNVVVVATGGGDFTSVQAAIDSITDASASNPYLVWVAPGVYSGQVTMKPNVHLQGAGLEATVISAAVGASFFPPDTATLELASESSVRDMSVENHATSGNYGTSLLAQAGTAECVVAGVVVSSLGTGISNIAAYIGGTGTDVKIEDSTITAESGTFNTGLQIGSEARLLLHDVSVTARGGGSARGVVSYGPSTVMEAYNLQVTAEDGTSNVYGLEFRSGAQTYLVGGTVLARSSDQVIGIHNQDADTLLETVGTTVIAEDGAIRADGLFNYNSATATLRGGSFIGRRGGNARGIYNGGADTVIETYGIEAWAHDADYNSGIYNLNSASARLHGGSFIGRGGTYSYGINNAVAGTVMYAWSVDVVAEDGSYANYGMQNYQDSAVVLYGGSFTARGGTNSYGIYESGAATTLEATGVTALSEDGVQISSALYCSSGAAVVVHGGSFVGVGGIVGAGIRIRDATTTLDATGIVVYGGGGSSSSYAIHQQDGASRLALSQLDSGFAKIAGTLTCFQIYDASFSSYSCP